MLPHPSTPPSPSMPPTPPPSTHPLLSLHTLSSIRIEWMKVLYYLRFWNIFLFLATLAVRATYIGLMNLNGTQNSLQDLYQSDDQKSFYYAGDIWYTIALSALFIPIYINSLRDKNFINRYARVTIMFGFTVILLYLNMRCIIARAQAYIPESQLPRYSYSPDSTKYPTSPFDCAAFVYISGTYVRVSAYIYQSGQPNPFCAVGWTSVFLAATGGFFVVMEVILAFKIGPLKKPNSRFENRGYQPAANVEIVRPDQAYSLQKLEVMSTDGTQHLQHLETVTVPSSTMYPTGNKLEV